MFGHDGPSTRLLACRILQLFSALLGAGTGAWMVRYLHEQPQLYAVGIGCWSIIFLLGTIGIFAFKRPSDIHWHLMLSLDWLAVLLGIYNVVIFLGYGIGTQWDNWVPHQIVTAFAAIAAVLGFCASLYCVVRAYRMYKQGKLPRSGEHAREVRNFDLTELGAAGSKGDENAGREEL